MAVSPEPAWTARRVIGHAAAPPRAAMNARRLIHPCAATSIAIQTAVHELEYRSHDRAGMESSRMLPSPSEASSAAAHAPPPATRQHRQGRYELAPPHGHPSRKEA